MHTLINADCQDYLRSIKQRWDTIFADPPDNIGQKYRSSKDKMPDEEYIKLLRKWLFTFVRRTNTVWFSYNSRWTFEIGRIVCDLLDTYELGAKSCVQTFTFGQHNQHDLGNCHRPLLRLRNKMVARLYPNSIRVPSWRQLNRDRRADPRGRIPGDVFDFPRVTGNSKQRRHWHPTQLHEGLVERCVRLTTPPGGTVLDPFAGTGTTLRACKSDFSCTLIETDPIYCAMIADEHKLKIIKHKAQYDR